jgi:hypothetical protein
MVVVNLLGLCNFLANKFSVLNTFIIVQIRGDLDSPVQVGSDTMTAFVCNDIY